MIRQTTLWGALLGLACALVACGVMLSTRAFFGAEDLVYDAMSRRLAADRDVDDRIVIVAINEQSIAALSEIYGRPPYSRGVHALILDELTRDGAKVVAFDLLFDQENLADPEGDRAFATSLANVVTILPVQTTSASAKARPLPADFASSLWKIDGAATPRSYGVIAPHAAFRSTAGVGTIRLDQSQGSTVRRYAVADRTPSGYVPGLALEVFRAFRNLPRHAAQRQTINGARLFMEGTRGVPVDQNLSMLIRWNGRRKGASADDHVRYPLIDFNKVVLVSLARNDSTIGIKAEDLDRFAAQFKGKIVLVAYTAGGLYDLRPTPVSSTAAGVEIHANAIDNLLNGHFNAPVQPWFTVPLLLLTGALAGALLMRIHSHVGAAAFAIGAIVVILAGAYGLLFLGLVMPSVAGISTIALTYGATTITKYIAEQAHSAQLRATFGRYVSPQILTHILANPDKVQLGGERRELTILFSDIRGFTSISEAAEPEEVVEMLNEYLTEMVEILLRHGGTLDKFIGDAVMGFWNAPVADDDHARHGVACAVEMIEATTRIRERWEKIGKASIRIGIGLNTGDAVAGNIGAEQVFSYTVIGDAVNLASRLESKNKDYSTEIIISEFTLARIGDEFETVYLDEVKVKGKDKAVKIYEVRGRAGAVTSGDTDPDRGSV
jgi:adenylate cyclase